MSRGFPIRVPQFHNVDASKQQLIFFRRNFSGRGERNVMRFAKNFGSAKNEQTTVVRYVASRFRKSLNIGK